VQRSSESIGAIAAALAKAQGELINPEKSLVATIRGRDGERTFRYAPLSSGLEIVRKALGQHEIATIQRTEIDREAGLIRLTTVLAHSSGEWMSSDWPVCQISDISAPQRMGAALTYARRYALFALVGIAGEDDVDAPDLPLIRVSSTSTQDAGLLGRQNGRAAAESGLGQAAQRKPASEAAKPILTPDLSAACRDRLVAEIDMLGSANDTAVWAHRALPMKNRLQTEDAMMVERAFTARLAGFADENHETIEVANQGLKTERSLDVDDQQPPEANTVQKVDAGRNSSSPAESADYAGLVLGKIGRKRDRAHRLFVASKPCLICGRCPADAHHLRFAQARAMGRKVSDEFTVPLCRTHHRELHLRADEAAWWQEAKLDPLEVAQRLWRESRGLATPSTVPSPAS